MNDLSHFRNCVTTYWSSSLVKLVSIKSLVEGQQVDIETVVCKDILFLGQHLRKIFWYFSGEVNIVAYIFLALLMLDSVGPFLLQKIRCRTTSEIIQIQDPDLKAKYRTVKILTLRPRRITVDKIRIAGKDLLKRGLEIAVECDVDERIDHSVGVGKHVDPKLVQFDPRR